MGRTYDCECSDDFARWLDVGGDDVGDEVGGHAENCDHRYQRETTDEDKSLRERSGAIVWDRHDVFGAVVLIVVVSLMEVVTMY